MPSPSLPSSQDPRPPRDAALLPGRSVHGVAASAEVMIKVIVEPSAPTLVSPAATSSIAASSIASSPAPSPAAPSHRRQLHRRQLHRRQLHRRQLHRRQLHRRQLSPPARSPRSPRLAVLGSLSSARFRRLAIFGSQSSARSPRLVVIGRSHMLPVLTVRRIALVCMAPCSWCVRPCGRWLRKRQNDRSRRDQKLLVCQMCCQLVTRELCHTSAAPTAHTYPDRPV